MSAKAKARAATPRRAAGKAAGAAKLRARAVGAPRLQPKPMRLRTLPAGPVAAFGLGELLIRAWAARQCAA